MCDFFALFLALAIGQGLDQAASLARTSYWFERYKYVLDEMSTDRYEEMRLPLSGASARAWLALHETRIRPLPDGTSFGEIVRAVREAVRGRDGKPAGFQLYFDPSDLEFVELKDDTPIACPFIGQEDVSLHVYLEAVLTQYSLFHHVHGSVVIVEHWYDDYPEFPDITAAEARAWLLLQQDEPMKFPKMKLSDALAAIQKSTVGKAPEGRGLVVRMDQWALRDSEQTGDSLVAIDMDPVPLATGLGLMLKPLGLQFSVEKNGVVVIRARESDRAETTELRFDLEDVAQDYQYLRYCRFHDHRNDVSEMRQMIHALHRLDPNGQSQRKPGGFR